jgi:electron transport complex protein RnfD
MEEKRLFNLTSSPHLRSEHTVTSEMLNVIIALLPATVFAVFHFGLHSLLVILMSVVSACLTEFVFDYIAKKPNTLMDGSAIVTGLLLALCLPPSVPLYIPYIGSLFAVLFAKCMFGGLGKNIVNPALAARVFLFSWAGDMTKFASPGNRISSLAVTLGDADVVAGATPLASLGEGTIPDVTLGDMFIGNIGGYIGEISSLLLIIGGIYLLVRRVITWHIPVAYVGTVAILTYIFPLTTNSLSFMLYEITAGGLLLGAIFMATDYVTSPITSKGRIVYGIGCGAITVLIRYFGGYPEGVSFSILIMNLLVWYLDILGMPKRFGAVKEKKEKKA